MIEKKVWKNVLYGTWTEDLREKCVKEKVFENSFTEVKNDGFTTENSKASSNRKSTFRNSRSSDGKRLSSNRDEVVSSSTEYPSSLDQDNRDNDRKPVDDSFDKNIDEVDYFDSDEYMECQGHRYDEKAVDLFLEDTTKSVNGRYS
jgi:hypothetical protein